MTRRRRHEYKPLEQVRRYRRPWALASVTDLGGITIVTEAGEVERAANRDAADLLLRRLDGYCVFTPNYKAVLRCAHPQRWRILQRGAKVIDARHDDAAVRLMPVPIGQQNRRFVPVMFEYLGWLESRGVWPTAHGSWSSLGRHLWTSTLERPVTFRCDEVGRDGYYGARKQIREPGRWRQAAHYDIRAAYPAALGGLPMPQTLAAASPTSWSDPECDGIAHARVVIPKHLEPWTPLPISAPGASRRAIWWEAGTHEGWWPTVELRAAASYDCKVTVHQVYAGRGPRDVFRDWLGVIDAGRVELSRSAARLLKLHANALWSSFGYAPVRGYVKRYTDDECREPTVVRAWTPPDFGRDGAYVSALVAGRVRTRVLTEALAFDGLDLAVVHVDTDGIIGARGRPPFATGAGVGSWRKDRELRTVEVRAPQTWRYTCEGCGDRHPRWHYVVAGAMDRDAARFRFDRAA